MTAEQQQAVPEGSSPESRRPFDYMPTVINVLLLIAAIFFLVLALVQLAHGHPPDNATVIKSPSFFTM